MVALDSTGDTTLYEQIFKLYFTSKHELNTSFEKLLQQQQLQHQRLQQQHQLQQHLQLLRQQQVF